MTNQEKLNFLKNRKNVLLSRPVNMENSGVIRKINREIRKLES